MSPRRPGTTLVELLVAIPVMALMAVGIFNLLHTSTQGTERLMEEAAATNHAVSLLESLLSVPFHELPEIPAGTPDTALPALMAAIPRFSLERPPDPAMLRTAEVATETETDYDPATPGDSSWGGLKRVRVEVRWMTGYLRPPIERRIVFETLVTDDGEVWR